MHVPCIHPPRIRFADTLSLAHDSEHLTKFEELLEAAVDLEAVPEDYLICATYDPRLQVMAAGIFLPPRPQVVVSSNLEHMAQ
jgi:hypothetical protein